MAGRKRMGDKAEQPTLRSSAKSADDKPKRSLRRSKAKEAPKSEDFEQARTRAERLLRDPEATAKLADAAETKAKSEKGPLKDVLDDVKALIRLVRAYASGTYRSVSWESMVLIVGTLIYLVSPLDVIPDFLPGGLIDDAAVVVFVLGLVRVEVAEFRAWEAGQGDDGLEADPVAA
jgi:uncharacterized membrane protein YkvA (DUF1232 family)